LSRRRRAELATVSPRDLLSRVLAEPRLVDAVRALPPRELGILVNRVGLEDAGEIVALATPEQLLHVLDDDLWRSSAPGRDESLDDERFAVWLEVLLEAGDRAVADKLAGLPDELVMHGLFRQVLVLDMDALGLELAELDEEDVDQIEKNLDGCLGHEFEGYRVISRRHDGWDAVLGVLVALDTHHHATLSRILERLAHASRALIDDEGGLIEALSDAEMLASDAAADRADRRAAGGFVAPSDARSFLSLALKIPAEDVLADDKSDPVTRAYFRQLDSTPAPASPASSAAAAPLLALIEKSVPGRGAAPKLLPSKSADPGTARFVAAMNELAERDGAAHARRLDELAYLVNVLIAGESKDGRALRPIEAVERAVGACAAGLAYAVAHRSSRKKSDPVEVLAKVGADRLFRIGWYARR
jgi:hypothetical protein